MSAPRLAIFALTVLLAAFPSAAWAAQAAAPASQNLTVDLTGQGAMTEQIMQILALVTVLSVSYAKVQAAVTALAKERLLLAEDAERYLERARREPRIAP